MLKQLSFLFLPLIGGYAFSVLLIGSAYHAARESGHRLYFRAFFYAIWLWITASLIHIIIIADDNSISDFLRPFYLDGMQLLDDTWLHTGAVAPLDFSNRTTKYTVALMAFALGPLLGHLLNIPRFPVFLYHISEKIDWLIPSVVDRLFFLTTSFFQKLDCKFIRYVVRNNDFERLILESYVDQLPILFSLKSNKVYVGYVVKPPNPLSQRRNIRILPLLSGYRDDKNQQVSFTTYYFDLVLEYIKRGYDLSCLEMVLVADEVVSMHIFDVEVYETNFGGRIPRQELELPR